MKNIPKGQHHKCFNSCGAVGIIVCDQDRTVSTHKKEAETEKKV
jgi:hypothetical protein